MQSDCESVLFLKSCYSFQVICICSRVSHSINRGSIEDGEKHLRALGIFCLDCSVSSFEAFELHNVFINYFLHQTDILYEIANLRLLCLVFQKPVSSSLFISSF